MNILLIGGTGFLGSAIARELARRPASADFRFTLPTRRRDKARHLLVLPTANVVDADVHDPAALARLMQGQDVVISLVGILKGGEGEPYGKGFARAHVELPQKIAAAAKAAGVRRVLHVSALKTAIDAPSGYLRSKAVGEAMLRESGLDLTIFRPSVIFGPGDSFLTLFARMAKIAPFFPLAGADARFQPVWVEDVAAAVADSLDHAGSIGAAYDLCGPKQYSLRELVSYAAAVSGHPRFVIGLPESIAWLQAWAMEFIPNGPMTRDNIRSMRVPSVCESSCTLPFGRTATALEMVAPLYLMGCVMRWPLKVWASRVFYAALLLAPLAAFDVRAELPIAADEIDGVVRFSGVEGGCWKIDTADGTAYEPVNLQPAMRRDGLAVRFRARPFDGGTICMVGRPVKIIGIRERAAKQRTKDTR